MERGGLGQALPQGSGASADDSVPSAVGVLTERDRRRDDEFARGAVASDALPALLPRGQVDVRPPGCCAPEPDLPAPTPVLPPPPRQDDAAIWAHLARIKQCESGGRYDVVGERGQYFGAYQFSLGTWASVGGVGRPDHATPAEQDYRAWLLYTTSGPQHWPVCQFR